MARQATICKVRLLDPGVIDAVIRNDESVCGTSNPLSFKKLREAMLMGFVVKGKSVEALGPASRLGSRGEPLDGFGVFIDELGIEVDAVVGEDPRFPNLLDLRSAVGRS